MTKTVKFTEGQVYLIHSILEEKYNEKIRKALPTEAYEIKEVMELLDETPTYEEIKEALEELKKEINTIPWNGSLE